MAGPSGVLPEITFVFYQMMFAACTVQIVVGGSFERGRILPSLVFSFLWATIVYCPIACWTWNSNVSHSSPLPQEEFVVLTSCRAGSTIFPPSTSPAEDLFTRPQAGQL